MADGKTSCAVMIAFASAGMLTACGTPKKADPKTDAKLRVAMKRQAAACASQTAYDRVKSVLFDEAIAARDGDRTNLDVLADYSTARMEQPVVEGWDPALDITRCSGRFVLDLPQGAERGLGGERRLSASLAYTAQAAADGSGYVYRVTGAEPVVVRLAAFDLNGLAYRPPPAIDNVASPPSPVEVARADAGPRDVVRDEPFREPLQAEPSPHPPLVPERPVPTRPVVSVADEDNGEGTVRAFYAALGDGDGAAASARVVPEKRSGRVYSPQAITRFYGNLAEPLRLTSIEPAGPGRYRVSYRYAAGRSRCDGRAIVSITDREGSEMIRSIQALDGC